MYSKLADHIYLGKVEFPRNEGKTHSATPTNHIWIQDISGSTAPFVRQLGRDMMMKVDTLPDGDYLTYCVFSSKGEYRVVLKGVKVEPSSRNNIKETIDRNSHATNLTCFSDILKEVASIVPDLKTFSSRFSLMFFTDGFPVPDSQTERTAIVKAIDKIKGLLTRVMLVGYGEFYNRELLGLMAEQFGGSLIHSEDMPYFSVSMDKFVQESIYSEPRISVKIPPGAFIAFTVDKSGVTIYEIENRNVQASPDSGCLYWIDSEVGDNVVVDEDAMIEGVYGAALILSQKMQADLALQVLGGLGDVRLVGMLGNAMTQSEFGIAEASIQSSALDVGSRFLGGRERNCLPNPNAPCAMDILQNLVQDPTALFFPYDKDFHYKPIGRGTVYPDGTPKFVPDDKGFPMTDLVWNDNRLNLSVRVRATGHIELGEGHEAVGFAKNYPTFVWRNYTIIRDGALNVTHLPVFSDNKKYLLELDKYPTVNKAMMESLPNATELSVMAWEELHLSAAIKVVKEFIATIKGDKEEKLAEFLTPEQDEFLKRHSITKSGFSPQGISEKATDYYMATQFSINIKGFSSLPKLSVVAKKKADGKLFTRSEEIVAFQMSEYDQDSLGELVDELPQLLAKQRDVRYNIQKAKFAVVLGHKWFPEFTSRENCVITIDEQEFEFVIKPLKVEI